MIWLRNLVLIVILIIITYTDIKRQEIDYWPINIGFVFMIIFGLLGYSDVSLLSSIIGFLIGGILFLILSIWGMGGGDIRLMAMVGFFLGWKLTLLAIYFSFMIGAITGLIVLVLRKKKAKEYIPFGPSIALGTVITIFFGQAIIHSFDFLWFLG